jgi:hypothetical protein
MLGMHALSNVFVEKIFLKKQISSNERMKRARIKRIISNRLLISFFV